MNKTTTILLTIFGLLALPAWVSGIPLSSTALGNGGEIYEVHAGTYAQLLPGEGQANARRSIVVLDVTRPGEATERLLVPATVGSETESSPKLLYSRESETLNVVWESLSAGELSVLSTRFDGSEFSTTVDELYFHPEGVRPLAASSVDELHLDLGDGSSVDAERQVLHLVWPSEIEGQFVLRYTPAIFLNGAWLGAREALTLPHLDPQPGGPGNPVLPSTIQVSVDDEDYDRVTLTFASAASRRVTSYDVEIIPMEIVRFSEFVRDLVRDSESFDPADIAQFADTLGVTILDGGRDRNFRSRILLTPSVLDYVASGTAQWLRDHGAGYDEDQLEELADAVGQQALELASSLFSPAALPGNAQPKSLRKSGSDPSTLTIDVSDQLGGESSGASSHLLELRFAVEMPLPDSGGSEITLFTSEDGRRFLAAWRDAEDEDLLWYVESGLAGNWRIHQKLHLGEGLALEEAHALLAQRIR